MNQDTFLDEKPHVDVIIPCRNEGSYIKQMLQSVIAQDYENKLIHIYVVDGMSQDSTRSQIQELQHIQANIYLLDNPQKTTPHALNIGIRNSSSPYIIRMDCHAAYPRNYISTLIRSAISLSSDNIGATIKTTAGAPGDLANGISIAMQLPISVGNSSFRTGITQIREVDTVPFGCFNRQIFSKVGLFDEEMLRNQDDELNARIKKAGGKIILIPNLEITYFARKELSSLARMFYQYGQFKIKSNVKSKSMVSSRQFAPPALVLTVLGSKLLILQNPLIAIAPEFLYFILIGAYYFYSQNKHLKNINLATKTYALLATIVIHFSYGTGFLIGCWEYIRGTKKGDLKLSR